VSSGYRQLEQELWVELRRGSGIFVRESKLEGSLSSALALDQWIANLFRCARKAGALPACGPAGGDGRTCSRPITSCVSSPPKNSGES